MFTPLASADIEAAYAWYEGQRRGLGGEFRVALEVVWSLLNQFPEAGPIAHRDLRRVLVPRFPYAVYYRLGEQVIEIRGCLHQRRDPRAAIRRG
jgi:plasmid stabilization system protein ParE